mgnify:CR=1 FL=1
MKKSIVCIGLSLFCISLFFAQNGAAIETPAKDEFVEKEMEKGNPKTRKAAKDLETAQKELEKKRRELKAEEERIAEEVRKNPKWHGPMRVADLKKEIENLTRDSVKTNRALDSLKNELKEEIEKKITDEADKYMKKPAPKTKNDWEKFKKEVEGWRAAGWGTSFGKAVKEEILRRIKKALEDLEKAAQNQPADPRGGRNPRNGRNNNFYYSPSGASADFPGKGFYVQADAFIPAGSSFSGQLFGEETMQHLNESVYADAKIFEQLFERLGGEFFIGGFTAKPALENQEQTAGVLAGLGAQYRFHQNWSAEAGFEFEKSNISATFPVAVADFESGITKQTEGRLSGNLKNTNIRLGANFCAGGGKVQLVAGAAAVLNFYSATPLEAAIQNVKWEAGQNAGGFKAGVRGSLGAAFYPTRHLYLACGGFYQSTGAEQFFGLRLAAGWRLF